MTELLTEVAAANQQATEELQAAQQKAKEAEEEVRAAMAITWHEWLMWRQLPHPATVVPQDALQPHVQKRRRFAYIVHT